MPVDALVHILEKLPHEEQEAFVRAGLAALEREKLSVVEEAPNYLDIESAFKERPQLDWVIPSLVLRGTVNFLGGAGGRGKSLISLYLGVELASGLISGYFTKDECPSRKVLIVNLEDPPEVLNERLQTFIKPQFLNLIEVLNKNLKIWPAIGVLGPLFKKNLSGLKVTEAFKQLQQTIEQERPDLVILDPIMRLLGVEENDNSLVGEIFTHFEKIAKDFGLSWLLVHHTSKNLRNSEQDIALRGASGFADAARSVWTVTSPSPAEESLLKGNGPSLKLNFPKISYGPPKNSVLFRFEPNNGVSWKCNDPLIFAQLKLQLPLSQMEPDTPRPDAASPCFSTSSRSLSPPSLHLNSQICAAKYILP